MYFLGANVLLPLCRSFIEDSQAGIKISPQDNNYMGSTDRLVTLSGTIEEQMRATDLIVSKLSEDPHYTQSMNYPFSYPSMSLFINYVSCDIILLLTKAIICSHAFCGSPNVLHLIWGTSFFCYM